MIYASLLGGFIDSDLSDVRLVVSDDHEGIKAAVAAEMPGVEWQWCTVHFISPSHGRCDRSRPPDERP